MWTPEQQERYDAQMAEYDAALEGKPRGRRPALPPLRARSVSLTRLDDNGNPVGPRHTMSGAEVTFTLTETSDEFMRRHRETAEAMSQSMRRFGQAAASAATHLHPGVWDLR